MEVAASAVEKRFLTIHDWVVLGGFVLAVGGVLGGLSFYASNGRVVTRSPESYYPMVTDSLLSGQLHLKVEPRPELMKLSNPYDSALNQPYRMLDLSLYQGRYYFYWGLTPVVLFFGPFLWITGRFPSEALACAFFGTAALGCMGWLILSMRRRYFPEAGVILTTLALGCVSVASFLPLLAMGNGVYGVPIAAAAFCQAALWCCLVHALHAKEPAMGWTTGAGLALGFALGARPNYLLWSVVLILPLAALWQKHPGRRTALTCAAGLPPLLAIAAMLWLNWLRFGEWTEFGMHYQLTGPAQPEVLFSWKHILSNFGVYGWNPPILVRFFPFVTTMAVGPFGVFSTLPVVFGVLGLVGLRAAKPALSVPITVALGGLGGLLATCAFFGCGGRYQVDYLPAMVTAGALGLLVWGARPARVPQWLAGGVVALVLSVSGAIAVLLQIQAWGSQGDRMLPLARMFNRPVFWIDRLVGRAYGPVQIELELPHNKVGAFEPVIATGDAIQGGELVFLNYLDGQRVRIGFFQTGTTHWLSESMPVDFTQPHRLDIRLGALNPPGSHPIFSGMPASRRIEAEQVVFVAWDGQLVYQATLDFGFRRGGRFTIGANELAPGVSNPRFTGKISKVTQSRFEPELAVAAPPLYGPWRIKLQFPTDAKPGRYDPLLVSGITGAADFVNVFYPEPGKVAFSHDAWGFGGSSSATFAVDLVQEHLVEIDHGGLYPAPSQAPVALAEAARAMQDRLRVTLDGVVVLDVTERTHRAPAETVTAGENRLGGSTTAARFSGRLISAERSRADPGVGH